MPGLDRLRGFEAPGIACVYAGIALLVVAWWRLGRLLNDSEPPGLSHLRRTLISWAGPLAVAPPLFSRDVYCYLAQGAMVGSGLDPYKFGIAALGGPLAAQAPGAWQHTPTPYGPAFLFVASAVTHVVSPHESPARLLAGVLVMRLIALLALGVLVAVLPPLARACGVAPDSALWLVALNPLVLLHVVSGAHNDALMVALLAAGVLAAVRGFPAYGAVLVTLAALVKAPAVLGLAVVAVAWADTCAGRWRMARAAAGTVAVAGVVAVVVTADVGTGYGWVGALATPASAHSWSLTAILGRLTQLVLHAGDVGPGLSAANVWRWAGVLAFGCGGAFVWWRWRRLGPVYALGLTLAALALLGPSVRPWYLLWALAPIAAAAPEGLVRTWAPVCCAVFAVLVPPSGFWPSPARCALAVAGVALAFASLWWVGWARGVAVLVWPPGFRRGEREPGYST